MTASLVLVATGIHSSYEFTLVIQMVEEKTKVSDKDRRVFENTDADNSGHINIQEFQSALRDCNVSLSALESRKMFLSLDEDGGGSIKKVEAVAWLQTKKSEWASIGANLEISVGLFQVVGILGGTGGGDNQAGNQQTAPGGVLNIQFPEFFNVIIEPIVPCSVREIQRHDDIAAIVSVGNALLHAVLYTEIIICITCRTFYLSLAMRAGLVKPTARPVANATTPVFMMMFVPWWFVNQ